MYLAIIEKALSKKPENRFADMDEMIRAVEVVSRVGPPARQEEPLLVATLIDDKTEKKCPAVPPPLPKRTPPPLPRNGSSATLAAVPSFKERLGELSTSLATAPLAAVAVVAAWALFQAIFHRRRWIGSA